MNILQVNMHDIEGGAAKVAWALFKGYQERGHGSWLAVGEKRLNDPDILEFPHIFPPYFPLAKLAWNLRSRLKPLEGSRRGIWRIRRWLYSLADIRAYAERHMGREDFNFPGTRSLMRLPPCIPDVVHLHNLHENYFDLRYLPILSRQVPIVITMHDAWLLSGHCAHSFECQRWKIGCGHCPDLSIHPAILRDATAYNWERKRKIFSHCNFYVTTPSNWLMQKVSQSMLAIGVRSSQIIPNGVDLRIFSPENTKAVRAVLGISMDTKVLTFVANVASENKFKDYQTLREAIKITSDRLLDLKLLLLVIGENAPSEHIGNSTIQYIGFQAEPSALARYYQAADIYIHSARVETFPNSVLEAMACGIPVVATEVGGIPEQIRPGETGILIPPKDSLAMAQAIQSLIDNNEYRCQLGEAATIDVRQRFSLERQISDFLNWYEDISKDWLAKCQEQYVN